MLSASLSAVRGRLFLVIAAFALAAIALAQPLAGSAHDHRDVGDYTFVVGFINEPAIQGDTNGITLTVTKGDAPVTGLADTLKAQAIFGDQTRDFDLVPAWNEDGTYEAVFIPTQPGDYTFRFFGTIDGVDVDESFTSSPEGFDSVAARADLEFPAEDAGSRDTNSVAMPLAVGGATVLILGAVAFVSRRRAA
jgi:hypothetical protein